ncbi:MAG: tripartite tricarboxylate transporter substrate binding protein [Pseudomonadota bacterium]
MAWYLDLKVAGPMLGRSVRFVVAGAALLAVGAECAGARDAKGFPNRPISLIVPVAAGGGVDGLARLIAPAMSEVLNQSVVVENLPGAGGTVGLSRVAKAAPDGYTIGLGNIGTHAFSQTLYKKPLYNAVTDFSPVGLVAEQPLVLAVRPDLPVSNLHEFLAYAKINHEKMQFGSPGLGSGSHFACVMFNAAAGLAISHIPYRGGGPAMNDLIAGRIDYWCPFSATAIPLIKNKQIKAVAILSKERAAVMPEVSTAHEQGLKDFDTSTWNALFAPKDTPAELVAVLNEAANKAVQNPRVRERMESLGMDIVSVDRRSPEYLLKFVRDEVERWAPAVRASGLSIE